MNRLGTPVRLRSAAAVLAVLAVLGAGVAWATSRSAPAAQAAAPTGTTAPVVRTPTVRAVGAVHGRLSWTKPLRVAVRNGRLLAVQVTDRDGLAVSGALRADGSWISTATLLPYSAYRAVATVRDSGGRDHQLRLTARTTSADRVLRARLSPGDGAVAGVGLPVTITLNHPVTRAADRAAVVHRLTVTTRPHVTGAWRWMNPTELHYRGRSYWAAGTRISVQADLDRLHLSGGTWGSRDARTTTYRVGPAMVSTVDVARHLMTVRRNGEVLRVLKVSTGRDKYPTRGGVHLVLEKTELKIMDSATVGIPRNSPDGYYEKVPFSVRISYSGEFVHSADWSVRDQGVRNVSHGCVNLSPSDAEWFFGLARRGDVVDVVNTPVAPLSYDPGTSDWNIPFSRWAN